MPHFELLNPWMLLGLAAVAIPVIIHLLNRRRYEVVDWGAMQFLQISEVTRRRLLIEEILLMVLRMTLLAVLVYALAGPLWEHPVLAKLDTRPNRDVVLMFDGSASMTATGSGQAAHERAKEWALDFVKELGAGDAVAVLQAKQQVVPVVGELSQDLERVRQRIDNLAPPGGGCDWPQAVQAAHKLLESSKRGEREIILLSDGQRVGWADHDALDRWALLPAELRADKDTAGRPRLWYVNVDPERKADLPNWALSPLRVNRPVVPVDREVTFHTELLLTGQTEYSPPHRIRLEVDGKPVRDLDPPRSARPEKGKVPFSFTHRFGTAGSHLVTVQLEPDPPPDRRPPDYQIKDQLPGDNRQDFALEVVPAIAVLLVDGDPNPSAKHRGTDFLRDALSPARDPNPVVRAKVVTARDFEPSHLAGEPGTRPRVLVLANVARLTPPQMEAVESFLADGGGVLVTLGGRVEADAYNGPLFREGNGWLPARLDGAAGDESNFKEAVRPAPATMEHPALAIFKDQPAGGQAPNRFRGLNEARFPRWWKLTTPGKNSAGLQVAELRSATEGYPFLVERSYKAGRVLLCSVPLDNTWGTNLPDLPAFVPLAHELIYYLAGARSAEVNLRAGQPLRLRIETDADLQSFLLTPPGGETKPLSTGTPSSSAYPAQVHRQAQGAILVYEGTKETGVYRVTTPDGRTSYAVVQPDAQESDLTPCTEQDREAVSKLLAVRYENDRARILSVATEAGRRQEMWWWFLVGLIVLLCAEVWMTRRMVKNR
jgi:hypothetical protein